MSGMSVLLLEGHRISRRAYAGRLRGLGYEVAVATDAEHALELFRAAAFGCVVLHCELGGGQGYAVARQIRALEAGSGRVGILGTSEAPDGASSWRDAGMDDCLSRPIDGDALARAVARYDRTPAEDLPVLDRAYIAQVGLGDAIAQLMEVFARQADVAFESVLAHASAEAWGEARRAAHALKGSCGSAGARRAAAAALELERTLSTPVGGWRAALENVRAEVASVSEEAARCAC